MLGQKLNILIVDDNQGIRFLLDTLVQQEGHCAYTASGGLAALDLLTEHQIDLIFVDFKMPEMNGIEFVRLLEEKKCNANVVLMSAYSELIFKEHNNIVEYLVKPFDLEDVKKIIDKAAKKVAVNC